MNESAFFTPQDVTAIRDNPTIEAKMGVARRLGSHFRELPRQSAAYRMAVEIAMLLQRDTRDEVRAALSESIAAEAKTPTSLATLLANDNADTVAVPILTHSPKLTDALLLPLIHATQASLRLLAIAARTKLSSPACLALIEKQFEEVALAVLNRHADTLDEPCYGMIVRHYARSVQIMQLAQETAMQRRTHFPDPQHGAGDAMSRMQSPANDRENLDTADRPLLGRNDLSDGLLGWRMMMQRCQQGLPLEDGFATPWPGEEQHQMETDLAGETFGNWQNMVNRMNREGALQAPVMLMALSMGLVPLFALCLARHARASVEDTMAACTNNETDFRQLYQRSHLPSALYRLCWWTLAAAREQLARGIMPCSEEMRSAMARKLAQAEGLKINFARTIGQPVMEALLRAD